MDKDFMKDIENFIDNMSDDEFIKMMKESENDMWTIEIPHNMINENFSAKKSKGQYSFLYENIDISNKSNYKINIYNIGMDKKIKIKGKLNSYDIITSNGVA